MKIRLSKSYMTYKLYDTIEINKEDYPELEGKTDDEIVIYLNDNMWEFPIEDSGEENLVDEFEFNRDIVKEKSTMEEYTIHLLTEE